MFGLFDYTINSKEDLKYISKDSKIRNLHINFNCKLDGYHCRNLFINTDVIIINCIIEEDIIINNPEKFILIRNCLVNNLKCNNVGIKDVSLHIEHNDFCGSITINDFVLDKKNVTVYVYQNHIENQILIYNNVSTLADAAICISANRFANNSFDNIYALHPEFIDVKDNYYIDKYNLSFIDFPLFDNFSGYNRKYLGNTTSLFVLEEKYRKKIVLNNKILKVKNIPQYISNEEDPALKTGCEATACAIALSYILNRKITKNEMASYMKMGEPGVDNFWESFIGDIYNDGWGCMSSVSVDAINNYLVDHELDDQYYVLNTTNMPLYELLGFVNSGIPVIVWCTMGNKEYMFHKNHGSTKWDVKNEKLYWPGNDHSLVIIGYNFSSSKIYLADPETLDERMCERNIYEFENRFTELYSQSILILKKRPTR